MAEIFKKEGNRNIVFLKKIYKKCFFKDKVFCGECHKTIPVKSVTAYESIIHQGQTAICIVCFKSSTKNRPELHESCKHEIDVFLTAVGITERPSTSGEISEWVEESKYKFEEMFKAYGVDVMLHDYGSLFKGQDLDFFTEH